MDRSMGRPSTQRIGWLLRLFAVVSIVTGGVALLDVRSRLAEVKQRQAEIADARGRALSAVEGLRDYRVEMTAHLNEITATADSDGAERLRGGADATLPFRADAVAVYTDEVRRSAEFLALGEHLEINALTRLVGDLERVHQNVTLVKRLRMQANASSQARATAAALVRESLASLDRVVGQVVGKHRLAAAILFARRGEAEPLSPQAGWEELRASFRAGQRMAQISEDLQDLELATERLFAATQTDELISLKDNRIRQFLSRLRRNAIHLGDETDAFEQHLAGYGHHLFGKGSDVDPTNQTLTPAAGGLYDLTAVYLGELRELDRATAEAEHYAALCRKEEKRLGDLVAALRANAAVKSEQSLQSASDRLLLVAAASSAVFLVMATWVIGLVSRSVKETANKQLELNDALHNLKTYLEAFDRVQIRVEFSPDGIVRDVNQQFEETMGYSADEIVGRPHSALVTPGSERSEDYRAFWRKLREGEFQIGEVRRVAANGDTRWLHATYTPIRDREGAITKIVKYATDITDGIRAARESEQATRKARELARLITESPNEVYVINQETFRFEEVNQGAVDSTQRDRDELLALTPFDIDTRLEPDRFRELTGPLARGEVTVTEFHSEIRRKDGSTYPVQVSIHSARYDNTPVFVAFVTDLTQIQKLEQQLAQAQKLESIGQLAAGVAHEINTPMQFVGDNIEYLRECSDRLFRVVDGYRDLLNDNKTPQRWEERIAQMRELIDLCRFDHIRENMPAAINESREGVQRTVKIVRAMKEFSHPGAKEMTQECLNQLIESTVAISRNRWKYAAQLVLDLDPDLPDAPMLPSEVNQVLLNLIVNASDAIAEKNQDNGGGQGTITVRTSADDEWVVVEVEDDGCGMPQEVQRKAFDPFFTTKDVGEGTGQGLAITHQVIVNQHGGSVTVASQPGEGTTFTVKLPRDAQHLSAAGDADQFQPARV